MAGIVRKFFKNKKTKKEVYDDSDDDCAQFQTDPTTSTSSKPYNFTEDLPPTTTNTPKLHHDETIDNDLSYDQPSHKRRRANSSSPLFEFANEDSLIEYTQYTLQKWAHEEERSQERRKRKRAERRVEQENYVHSAMATIKLGVPTVSDIEKLRKERDQYKKEMEKYKSKFERMEKRCQQLEQEKKAAAAMAQPMFQPFSNYIFGPTPFQSFQPLLTLPQQQQQQLSGPIFTFGASTSSSTATTTMNPFQPAPPPLSTIGPQGPMAPRYADPINSFDYNDDDTSLSDLSNSSKSDTSSEDLKLN